MKENQLIITPKTKVMTMLEAYPELEGKLIDHVPAFKKLKNPILRKTVAKIATIQQAASVGKIDVEDLVNFLRKEVGQDPTSISSDNSYTMNKPEWFDPDRVSEELDVREMLAQGDHPVAQVMADLKSLPEGMIYKLIAPFITAPLIDKAKSIDFTHWINSIDENEFHIYFKKKN